MGKEKSAMKKETIKNEVHMHIKDDYNPGYMNTIALYSKAVDHLLMAMATLNKIVEPPEPICLEDETLES